jgi:hypothetical protein
MANNKKTGTPDQQIDTIDRYGEYVQESFDLDRLEDFVTGLGVQFMHFKGIPSPIGQKDRGDYRRNDGVDTITSNGMIYKCAGKFTATMTDNSRQRNRGEAGILDPSESKLVMPRFYDKNQEGDAEGDRIYLSPGDRIYVADPEVDVLVSNPQKMDFISNVDNVAMFPICKLELPIIDSRNQEYVEDIDYCITKDGNIRWLAGGNNPGIDPDTGKGRIYSIRYLYRAYWYITVLLKEVRVTRITENGDRSAERMPYHAIAVREFMFHNQNRGDDQNQLKPKDPKRTVQEPVDSTNPSKYVVPVEMSDFTDDEEQS